MNICLVSQHYPPDTAKGGIGTQTWNKAAALSALGHSVHVLSSAAQPGPALQSSVHGLVTVHRLQPPCYELPIYQEPSYWLGYSWSVLRHLRQLTASFSFDVIDFAEYGAEGFAYQLDRSVWDWVPVVVQLHAPLEMFAQHMGWPEPGSEFHQLGSFMERTSIRLADGLAACSANIADFVAHAYAIPRNAIDVVYTSVDSEAFRPAHRTFEARHPTVLFVGNLAWSKGVMTVVEAVEKLRARHPDIHLKIAGTGDQGVIDAIHEVRRLNERSNIEVLGFVDRTMLPSLYQEADVFCAPAQYEGGVATVYLEAMACACPVIGSRAGGTPEAVEDGETGFLVPPLDVEATATALDRILSDPDLGARMGRAGRRRVEEKFSVDVCIRRVLKTYEKAIGRAREKRETLKASWEAPGDQASSSGFAAAALALEDSGR